MAGKFFDKVYKAVGDDANREIYDQWAESYEADVGNEGYETPSRIAAALANAAPDRSKPVLDYGCGTGLSGAALAASGFSTIDGMDPSPGMLEKCRTRGLYRNLIELDLSKPIPVAPGDYQAIAAVGVISTGAGPASLMEVLINLLPTGGFLTFSLNDHALADPEYPAGVQNLKQSGHKMILENYGAHLPGLDMKSMIYIFEKT